MSEVAQPCLTLQPHRLQPARLLVPWDFPGKNTGVDWHFLLQGIFLTGIEPRSPALQADSSPGRPTIHINYEFFFVLLCLFCTIAYPLLGTNEQLRLHTHSSSSVAQSCPSLCDPMNHSTPGLPVHHQLPESTQTHVHCVGDAIQPSHFLSSLLLLPSIFPSIQVFSNELALHIRWPKYWSFSFSISPSNGHPGLISFSMDWLDLLAVQGTLKSLLQHHSSKAAILLHSAFFIVQLSHPYMTAGKTTALTR